MFCVVWMLNKCGGMFMGDDDFEEIWVVVVMVVVVIVLMVLLGRVVW